jgi:cyclopropane fatty-acyl-phospholipid synthase-like methyltransferase
LTRFYQQDYEQKGLTTDLPSEPELARLIKTDFRGSSKDFSRLLAILDALRIPKGARILDYGASWGYCTFQLRRAGYEVEAHEISQPRAAFGQQLGIKIFTDLTDIPGAFDVVYSSHVLEHVPNPRDTIRQQLGLLKPGGYVIAHTPNGSEQTRRQMFDAFHSCWGLVHPVLLTDEFIETNFADHPLYISSESSTDVLAHWDGQSHFRDGMGEHEMLLIVRNIPGPRWTPQIRP